MIPSVDLAHYGVSCAKDRVSVDCGTEFVILWSASDKLTIIHVYDTFQNTH